MPRKIKYCKSCTHYTLKSICSSCGKPTNNAGPAKFSPEDRFGKYRRLAKIENRRKP